MIFVFSLENETSFNAIYNYYAKMAQYRNIQEIPIILVGTQGTPSKFLSGPLCLLLWIFDFYESKMINFSLLRWFIETNCCAT